MASASPRGSGAGAARIVVEEERKDELGRALVALRRPVDELLHRGFELGHASPPSVLLGFDLFAKRLRDDEAEPARAFGRPLGLPDWPGRKRVA